MRIGLIADIHSNLPALEAVLRDMKKHAPDIVISLGDQVNLGPSPRETLALLKEEHVTCLHGNHERYILSSMAGDPQYAGANFASLRFNAALLTKEDISFPMEMTIEGVTFCHAMPGDDRFPVFDEEKAIPLLEQRTFDRETHIICGHGHNPTHIVLPRFTLHSIGSAGCMDDGVPGSAPYTVLTLKKGCVFLRPYAAQYDTKSIHSLFVRSGMTDYCPIMAHIACLQMQTNTDHLVPFVQRAQAMSIARNETSISMQTWQDEDAAYPWPDGLSTADFWKTQK